MRRRFRASNYQSTTRVKPFICTMPMRLDEGWNQIQFNLSDFTRRAYGTNYIETLRLTYIECKFTQTVELGGFTFQIDYILKMSFLQNLNSLFLSSKKLNNIIILHLFGFIYNFINSQIIFYSI